MHLAFNARAAINFVVDFDSKKALMKFGETNVLAA